VPRWWQHRREAYRAQRDATAALAAVAAANVDKPAVPTIHGI